MPHVHTHVLIRENAQLHLDALSTKRSRQELPLAAATEMIIGDLFRVCVCALTWTCICVSVCVCERRRDVMMNMLKEGFD